MQPISNRHQFVMPASNNKRVKNIPAHPSHGTPPPVHGFYESANGLHYAEHIHPMQRFFLSLLGLPLLIVPVPWVIQCVFNGTEWQWMGVVLVVLAAMTAIVAGGICLALALRRGLTLQWDRTQRRVWKSPRWPWQSRATCIPWTHVLPPSVVQRTSTGGELPIGDDLVYMVRLPCVEAKPMHLGSFDSEQSAAHWCERIAAQ